MTINTGKPSEAIFESFMAQTGAHVYRFEDYADVTKGRRFSKKIVSSKPSDYIVTYMGTTAFTEVKSISTGPRFDFSRIEKRQWREAFHVTRNEGKYYFYLHFMESNRWYQVPAKVILSSSKKSIREDEIQQYECMMLDGNDLQLRQ